MYRQLLKAPQAAEQLIERKTEDPPHWFSVGAFIKVSLKAKLTSVLLQQAEPPVCCWTPEDQEKSLFHPLACKTFSEGLKPHV